MLRSFHKYCAIYYLCVFPYLFADACQLKAGAVTCLFNKLSKPQTIKFMVKGSTAGNYTCTAAAKVKGNTKDVNSNTGSGTVLVSVVLQQNVLPCPV